MVRAGGAGAKLGLARLSIVVWEGVSALMKSAAVEGCAIGGSLSMGSSGSGAANPLEQRGFLVSPETYALAGWTTLRFLKGSQI